MVDKTDDTRGRPPRGSSRPGSGRPPGKFSRGGPPGRDGDRPFRSKRSDESAGSGWRPEGPRTGSRPFRDKDAGEGARRFEGSRPFRGKRDDERTGGTKPERKPYRPRAEEASPRPAPSARPPEPTPAEPAEERIAKVIARAGIASRRDAEAMIAEGRVTLNGEILASPAVNVTAADSILVDGEKLPARERTRLWLFHKPRGLVTTARDPEGRQTVFESLPEDMPRVVAIGRLDINTEGLLLLTNDGGLAKVIAHPDTGWLRRYKVRAHGEITQVDLDRLKDGVTVDEMEYGPVEARLDRVQGDNVWLTLGLREGKNREVKRILEHLGLGVNRLIRLSFGPFQLGDIEPGLVEEVRTKVLKDQLGTALAEQAGVDFESPVREPVAPFGSPKERPEGSFSERPPRERRDQERPFRRDDRPARDEAPERRRRDPQEPKRSVWRADEGGKARTPQKVPRRGADPREARAASAERPRERAGTIKAPAGRTVRVERLRASPAEELPRRAPRGEDRPMRRGPSDGPPRRPSGERGASGSYGGRDDRVERPRGAKPPGPRPFREDGANAKRSARPEGGQRPFRSGGKGGSGSRGGKPGGFKSGGFKSGGPKGGSKGGPRRPR